MSMVVNSSRFKAPGISFPAKLALINPSAESGNSSGWGAVSGSTLFSAINTVSAGWPGPKAGSYYFAAGNVALVKMQQDVDISHHAGAIDSNLVQAKLDFWLAGFDAIYDYPSVFLRALDETNVIIASASMEEVLLNTTWKFRSISLNIPPGTRKLRIEFWGTRESGTNNDVYVDEISLALVSSSETLPTSYDKNISRGDRTGIITVSATGITAGGGSLSGLVDGSRADNYWWNSGTGNGSQFIKFDFGAGASWIIDEIVWRQGSIAISHGVWQLEGSNDNSTWNKLGNDFTLTAGTISTGNTSNIGYRYVRLRHMSGTRRSDPWLWEIMFKAKEA